MAQAIQTARPEARPVRRGVHLNLHEGWIAGLLLVLMLVSVTASLATANWTDGLWLTTWAALGGLLFGALVSRLRLNGLLAFILAIIVGTAFVAWLLSAHVGAPPDATWNEKMLLIEDRIDQWLVRVLSGGIGTDAFVFLCVMGAMSWFLGYLSAWSVFRHHQAWGAILPTGAALLINLFYAPPQSGLYLMVYLLSVLLLLVRTTLLKRQQTWSAYAVRFAHDIGLDFLIYGVIFSGLIILIAWLIPPTAPGPAWFGFIWEVVREPWQDVQDDMSRAFSTVRGTNNAPPTTYFGSNLSMGGPVRLGNRDVFEIQAPFGRYWREMVFDKYTGTSWVSTADESANLTPNDPRMKTLPMDKRRVMTATVEVRLPTDNLVVSGSQPIGVSVPVEAKYLVGRLAGNQSFLDVSSLRLQNLVKLGDKYEVTSSISAADEESLRAASTDYPAFIRQNYLFLPPSVPGRVRDLAAEITANATNNYDKARAIETYLREHIKYNDQVPPVPAGWDGVDYTLFERPEGYCNYYASAMAVMARSIGIPARVASGYAVDRGEDGIFHVNESNAHSWPELYFGELGWIEFEPTASSPQITRPAPQQEDQNLSERQAELQGENPDAKNLSERLLQLEEQQAQSPSNLFLAAMSSVWGTVGIGIIVLGIALAGTIAVVQLRWQRQLRRLKPGAQAAAQMYRFAPYAGFREDADDTPDEQAQKLATLLPEERNSIHQVNAWFVGERYGARDLDTNESVQALATGTEIQKRMWRSIYQHHIGSRIRNATAWLKALPLRITHALAGSKRRAD